MSLDWRAQKFKDVNTFKLVFKLNAIQTKFQKDTRRNLTKIHL